MPSAAPAPFQREGVSTRLLIPHALGTHAATKKRYSLLSNLETWLLGEAQQALCAKPQKQCSFPGRVQEPSGSCASAWAPATVPPATQANILMWGIPRANPLPLFSWVLKLSGNTHHLPPTRHTLHIPLISLPSQAAFNPKFTRKLSKSRHTQHKYSQYFLSCQIHLHKPFVSFFPKTLHSL